MKKKVTRRQASVHEFLRDGRAPLPSSVAISRVMSANRGKNTSPEMRMRQALSALGLRGYRLNCKGVPGRPDIAFTRSKLAIFVHGCYWHRCPSCRLPLPKSHRAFWVAKFRRNKSRDARKERDLISSGWRVLTFWECQIEDNVEDCAMQVQHQLAKVEHA